MRFKSFKKDLLIGEFEELTKRHPKFSRFISEHVMDEVQLKEEKKKPKSGDGGSSQPQEMDSSFHKPNARKIVSSFCKYPCSIDLMLDIVQDELTSVTKMNEMHLRSLFSQLQHAYSDSRPDSPVDYSIVYHLENPIFLRDLGLNYNRYFNHDKNLLLDVCHQSTLLETLRGNQLEKTSFSGG
jgi:hypothetical protein